MIQKLNFYIITGGPGVGKTTLLDELSKRGYRYVPEVARKIIKEQMDAGGKALPWANTRLYSDMMLARSIEDFITYSSEDGLLFFDRGIPDTYGYEVLMNFDMTDTLKQAVKQYRYNLQVFILPPWPEIYETDGERKQDYDEAVATYDVMCRIYTKLGYTVIDVPRLPVSERADFVLDKLGLKS